MPLPLVAGAGFIFGAISERYTLPVPNYRDALNMTTGSDGEVESRALTMASSILHQEEGRRNVVYLDTEGVPTVGIGHKIVKADGLKVGDKISDQRVDEFFNADIASAFRAAVSQSKEIKRYNPDMIARLTSVNFQLGIYWRSKFPNTWLLIKEGKIKEVQRTLLVDKRDSKGRPLNWYSQTPSRAIAFVQTLQNQFA